MASDVARATDADDAWAVEIARTPERMRNVAVLGHLHSGKTALMDLLLRLPHGTRYTDTRLDEQARGVSVRPAVATVVSGDTRDKSWAVTYVDAPGHPQCADGAAVALRVCDGALLCVDVVEGLLEPSVRLLQQCARDHTRVVLVLTKLDRLVLELRLPPLDAYHKLRTLIDDCNCIVRDAYLPHPTPAYTVDQLYLSPVRGNVLFASALHGYCFTLASFAAQLYPHADAALVPRLWGDVWRLPSGELVTKSPGPLAPRTFVELVLAPVYKLYSVLLGGEPLIARRVLEQLGLTDAASLVQSDPRTLVARVLERAFGDGVAALTGAVAAWVPAPAKHAAHKAALVYAGPSVELARCDPAAPLVAHTAACLWRDAPTPDFDGLTRIFSGTLRAGADVHVMGEQYTHRQQEDMAAAHVDGLWLGVGRRRIALDYAVAGQLVLVGGVCAHVSKTATLAHAPALHTFRPLPQSGGSVVRVAVEPLNPSELPKLVESLRRANKAYGGLVTRVEESGEHVLIGTGELYLDAVLYDIRNVLGDVEVKVSDPSVVFTETVLGASSMHCSAVTPNAHNTLSMVASPLDAKLVAHAEAVQGALEPAALESLYGWDMLKAKGLWTFGALHTNALVDDALLPEGSPQHDALAAVKPFIVQGFDWATREGPLTHDAMRGVCFSLIGATLAEQPFHRGGGQIIPAARRVMYSSFLTAQPRLMEPVFRVDAQCPVEAVGAVAAVLTRRRGHVVSEQGIPGTPLVAVVGYVPVIDSFGLETDLRVHTQGMAFCTQTFHHWDVVPGDPLDASIVLRPLEPQPVHALAREFMVKTRRRKGLSDDVALSHYFDASMLPSVQGIL